MSSSWNLTRTQKVIKMPNKKTVKSVRLDDVHWQMLEDLTPFYGSNRAEVIRNIVLMWLDKNLGSETIKLLKENKVIQLGIKEKPKE